MHSCTIEIANIRCLIKSEENSLIDLARAQCEGFVSQGESDVEILIHSNLNAVKYPALPSTDPEQDNDHINAVSKGAKVFFARPEFAGYIDTKKQKAEVALSYPSAVPLESCLRICYSLMAVIHGGFLLHSAGVVAGKKASIFYGTSESGKTTVAK